MISSKTTTTKNWIGRILPSGAMEFPWGGSAVNGGNPSSYDRSIFFWYKLKDSVINYVNIRLNGADSLIHNGYIPQYISS